MNPSIKEAILQLTVERQGLSVLVLAVDNAVKTDLSKRAETVLAFRSGQVAFMFLGKAKGVLGAQNPYPESTNPKSRAIEPHADQIELADFLKNGSDNYLLIGLQEFLNNDHDEVEFLKALRGYFEKVVRAIKNDLSILPSNRIYQAYVEYALVKAEEAKMWLGQSLGLIRDEEKPALKVSKTSGKKPQVKEGKKPKGENKEKVKKEPKPKGEKKGEKLNPENQGKNEESKGDTETTDKGKQG